MALRPEQLERLRRRFDQPDGQQRDRQPRRRATQPQPDQSEGFLGDVGRGLAAGALELPSAVTGLADIPAGIAGLDRPFGRAASAIGEATGFQPSRFAEEQRARFSPQLQEAQRATAQAAEAFDEPTAALGEAFEGGDLGEIGRSALGVAREVPGVLGAFARNPRAIGSLVAESLPATVAGGLAGRGVAALAGTRAAAPSIQAAAARAPLTPATGAGVGVSRLAPPVTEQVARIGPRFAGALGEGAVMAGFTNANIDDEVDARRAALASLGIGIAGAGVAAGGAAAAQRAGLADIETVLAGGTRDLASRAPQRGLAARVGGGAVAEGVFQELPQEAIQQMGTNFAEGEPILQGVPRAAIEGMLAGGVLGGAVNIRRPRSAADATRLTDRPAAEEVTADPDQGPLTFDVVDQDVGNLLRYHRRLSTVAREATQHPDLQEQAIDRLDNVLKEFDRRGIPREVVDESLARNRHTELRLQEDQLQKRFAEAVQTNPAVARAQLDKIRRVAEQRQAIEQQFTPEQLQNPDFVVTRTLRSDPANDDLFRKRQGEVTNQLKPQSLVRLNEFRELPNETLLRDIARDRADREAGAQVNRFAPLREAAAVERGLTDQDISRVSRETFGDDQAVTEEELEAQTDEAFDAPAPGETPTEPDVPVPGEAPVPTEAVTPEPAAQPGAAPPAEVLEPRLQALRQAATQTQATRDALGAIAEAIGEADAGVIAGDQQTIAQRAESIFSERRGGLTAPRQALGRSLGRIRNRLGNLLGDDAPQTLTTAGIIRDFFGVQAPEAAEGPSALVSEAGTLGVVRSPGAGQTGLATTGEDAATRRQLQQALDAGQISQADFDQGVAALEAVQQPAAGQAVEPVQPAAQPTVSAEAQALTNEVLTSQEAQQAGEFWGRMQDEGDPAWEQLVAERPDLAAAFVLEVEVIQNSEDLNLGEQSNARFDVFEDLVGEFQGQQQEVGDVDPGSVAAIPADVAGAEAAAPTAEPPAAPEPGEAAEPAPAEVSRFTKPNGDPYQTASAARAARGARRFQDLGFSRDDLEVIQVEGGFVLQPMGQPTGQLPTNFQEEPNRLFPEAVQAMSDVDAAVEVAREARSRDDVRRLERVRRDLNQVISSLREAATDAEPSAELIERGTRAIRDAQNVAAPAPQQLRSEADLQAQSPVFQPIREAAENTIRIVEQMREQFVAGTLDTASLLGAARTAALNSGQPHLVSILDGLVQHPRAQGVRVSLDEADGLPGALGVAEATASTIWVDHNRLQEISESILEGWQNASMRNPESLFAEVVAHEMLHATTVETLTQAAPDAQVITELQSIQGALFDWLQQNLDTLTPDQRRMIEFVVDSERVGTTNLTVGQLELITYGLTNQSVRSVLQRIPDGQAPAQSMWQRVLQWFQNVLGLSDAQRNSIGTLFDRLQGHVDTIVDTDQVRVLRGWSGDIDTLNSLWRNANRYIEILNRAPARSPEMEELRQQAEEAHERALQSFIQQTAARERGDQDGVIEHGRNAERALRDVRQAANNTMRALQGQARGDQPLRLAVNMPSAQVRQAQQSNFDQFVAGMPGKLQDAMVDLRGRIRGLGMLSMFTNDFVDFASRWLPQLRGYYDTIRWRMSERNEGHAQLQDAVGPVGSWSQAKRRQLNKFLAESTTQGKWGFAPTFLPNAASATVDAEMARKFRAMPQDAQDVAFRMFETAHRMNSRLQAELRGDIERVFDEAIDRASQPATIARLQRERQEALDAHDSRQTQFRDAYLPLKRWGEWAVVYKSDAFREAERRGNRREIEQLKQDEQHFMVSFASSQFQARQLRREWESEFGIKVEEPFPRKRYERSNEMVPFDLLQRLKRDLTAQGESGPTLAISRALDRVYIEALAETSVRKAELRRLNVKGFDEDMVKAFVQHGQGVANLTSSIRINHQTRALLDEMQQSATRATRQRPQAMAALNEVLARHAQYLEGEQSRWQQPVLAGTSIWMLLTSPAYYIQNATQPFMLTMPVLAGRYGVSRTFSQMTRAYKEIAKFWTATRRGPHEGLLMDTTQVEDPGERETLKSLQDLGLLDVGIAADLGSLVEGRTRVGQALGKAHHRMIQAVRTVEVFNRGVTALSAYRLEFDQATSRGRSPEQAARSAKERAIEAVQTTQGDYSVQNQPRLISAMGGAGRVITQFRKFQLIQIGLLTRTVNQAFKGATPAEKAIGRRQMGYIAGMHAAIGGFAGLPLAPMLAAIVGRAFDDEDEPPGWELQARRAIGDKATADLVLRGLPAWAGIDVSNRLGMGLTFSVLPFTDVNASRDGMFTVLGSLLGPAAGLAAQFADGAGKISDGNTMAGVAQFLPTGLKNAVKAFDYYTHGVRTSTGVTAISAEEMDFFDLASQALGAPSKTITDRYNVYGMLRDTEQHFRDRTTTIKRAFTEAFFAGDRRGMDEARDEWRRLQQRRRAYGVGKPQPISELIKAPRERREAERQTIGGVPTERTTRRFVQNLFE